MENVWEYMRGNLLSMTAWNSYNAILDACNSRMKDAERITSITARTWTQVKTLAGWYKTLSRKTPAETFDALLRSNHTGVATTG